MASSGTSKDKKQMDITRPADAKPDIGSKPMIVGHKSMAGDPMMRETQESESKTTDKSTDALEEPAGNIIAAKKKIAPVAEETAVEEKPEEAEAQEEVTEQNETKVENVETSEAPKEPDSKPEVAKTDEKAGSAEEPKQEASAEENTETEEKTDKKIDPVAEAMERDDKLRKIIESKKYNVNIKQASSSGGGSKKWPLVLFGLLLAVLAGLFVLVDTGKLDAGFDLPFSIFGKEEPAPEQNIQQPIVEKIDEVPVSKALKLDYRMSVPDDWEYARKIDTLKLGDGETKDLFADTYTLPGGAILIIKQDMGGRGGDCQPDESDIPHQKGNKCVTLELIAKKEVTIDKNSLLYEDHKSYLVRTKITGPDGVPTYGICLETHDPKFFALEIKEPIMGLYADCITSISTEKYGYIWISIEGVDRKSEEFFENEDILSVEKALESFMLITTEE